MFILTVAASVPFFGVHAQDDLATNPATPAVEGATTTNEDINLQDLKNQPLEVRRQVISQELSDILTRLNVIYDKTKAALDRLTQNGIDTSGAQKELLVAADALTTAQTNINVFSDTSVSFEPTEKTPTPLRDAVIQVEANLRDAREAILQTLLSLKTAIDASAQQ